MYEITSHDMDSIKTNLVEVNNNLAIKKNRKGSQVSVSSASSCHSDSSEDSQAKLERKSSLQDIIHKAEDKKIRSEYKRSRSMSDGEAGKWTNDDPCFEVFPSLPNSVLEKMGLFGSGPRERLNEEEIEQKFGSLALAFTIDAATIKDRCQRQRRYRDQTEKNLAVEIERLKDKLALIQPLCTDYETVELLSTLLSQVDIVMKATLLVSISAERYGSVQHEERLTESVNLMVNHVQLLKQQRDSARRQLQYTKRVLQNPGDSTICSPTLSQKTPLPSPNRKIICKRRASIATFPQPLLEQKQPPDIKKITRRISDLSQRASSLTRAIRPIRLELGGDLVKIHEGYPYEALADSHKENSESETDNNVTENNKPSVSSPEETEPPLDLRNLSVSEKMKYKLRRVRKHMEEKYNQWTDDGTIHEVCCFCALLCFSISLLTMVNILVEYEYAKRGWGTSYMFWSWTGGYNDRKYNSIRN